MTSQLLFVLLFVLFITFSNLITRFTLRKNINTYRFTGFHNLFGALVVLPLIFFDYRLPSSPLSWVFLFTATISSIAGDLFYFKSIAIEEMSVLTLVARLRLVIVFIFGALLFKEAITLTKILAMVLVFLGSVIVAYQRQKMRFSKGAVLMFVSNIFLAAMFIIDKKVVQEISVPLYNFINFIFSGSFFIFLSLKSGFSKKSFNSQNLIFAGGAGALLSLASLSRRYAYRFGQISVATPLLNLSVVFTVITGILFLNEKDRIWQKLAGLCLVLFGSLLLI